MWSRVAGCQVLLALPILELIMYRIPCVPSNQTILNGCRTPEEFAHGHSDGAINVPLKVHSSDGSRVNNPDFEAQMKQALAGKESSKIVCTCFAGRRGALAAEVVCGAGFTSVHNVIGGMGAWEAEGLPVNGKVKPPGSH